MKTKIESDMEKMNWMQKEFGNKYFDLFGKKCLSGMSIDNAIEECYNHFKALKGEEIIEEESEDEDLEVNELDDPSERINRAHEISEGMER